MLHTNKQIRREFTATRGLVNDSNDKSFLSWYYPHLSFSRQKYNDVLLYAEVG